MLAINIDRALGQLTPLLREVFVAVSLTLRARGAWWREERRQTAKE